MLNFAEKKEFYDNEDSGYLGKKLETFLIKYIIETKKIEFTNTNCSLSFKDVVIKEQIKMK